MRNNQVNPASPMQNGLLLSSLLLSAVVPLLIGLGYDPLHFEVLSFTFLLVLVGFGISYLFMRMPKVVHGVTGLAVYWVIDTFFAESSDQIALALLLGGAVFFLLGSKWSENIRAMLLVFSMVWIAGVLIEPQKQTLTPPLSAEKNNTVRSSKRPIVHFIIDEQMSPRTLPQTVPSTHPAEKIEKDYLNRGFSFYSHVISHSSQTQHSISEAFLLSAGKNSVKQWKGIYTHKVLHNQYFNLLAEKGYEVSAIQSDFLEFCFAGEHVHCHTYSRGNNGRALTRYPEAHKDRFILALLELHSIYIQNIKKKPQVNNLYLYKIIAEFLKRFDLFPSYERLYYSRPMAVLSLIDQIDIEMQRIAYGRAYVYHLLLPHFPYMLGRECQLKPYQSWSAANRYGSRVIPNEKIYVDYWDQSACLHQRLMKIIETIRKSPAGKDALVIVHGDHGARVRGKKTDGHDSEMTETFFAVYDNKASGTLIDTEQQLQPLFHQTVHGMLQ